MTTLDSRVYDVCRRQNRSYSVLGTLRPVIIMIMHDCSQVLNTYETHTVKYLGDSVNACWYIQSRVCLKIYNIYKIIA